MKRFLLISLSLIGATSCLSPRYHGAQNMVSGDNKWVVAAIEHAIAKVDPDVNVGISVYSLDSQKTVVDHNSKRLFVPGSVAKVLTLAAALHYLGPNYRFLTKIFADGADEQRGSIKNLYIKGSGDPGLMEHDLFTLALELKQRGIKEIKGNIYVDDFVFDNVLWSKGAMWDDRHRGFAAPVSGLNLNYNRLLIKTVPALTTNHPAHAVMSPFCKDFTVQSRAKTVADGTRSLTVDIHKNQKGTEKYASEDNEGLNPGDTIVISGKTPLAAGPQYSLLAVKDPSLMAGSVFKELLLTLGIKIDGQVKRQVTPKSAQLLAAFESRSLSEALIDFTKISNNVANDALAKAIASFKGKSSASAQEGMAFIRSFLKDEVGIDVSELVVADGSGLSRYNQISASQLVKILNYASNNFLVGPEFLVSLPIGGEGGTLTNRFVSDHLRGKIRAKTGSMTGASALAGYFKAHGETFAFAIMVNGYAGSGSKYLEMQEAILSTFFHKDAQLATNAE